MHIDIKNHKKASLKMHSFFLDLQSWGIFCFSKTF